VWNLAALKGLMSVTHLVEMKVDGWVACLVEKRVGSRVGLKVGKWGH
jgi:hypothetical protein